MIGILNPHLDQDPPKAILIPRDFDLLPDIRTPD